MHPGLGQSEVHQLCILWLPSLDKPHQKVAVMYTLGPTLDFKQPKYARKYSHDLHSSEIYSLLQDKRYLTPTQYRLQLKLLGF